MLNYRTPQSGGNSVTRVANRRYDPARRRELYKHVDGGRPAGLLTMNEIAVEGAHES
jgi:hypothetical protein